MLQDLYITHRRKPHIFAEDSGPVWSTCLRSLAFHKQPQALESHPDDETYSQTEAYQFLLEIVCGLHSPIVGETEVFGQFKLFATEWVKQDPKRATLVQRLLGDAKLIRARHLSGIGTQSYGGWLKRRLIAPKLHVLGAGHLTKEILPYLEKQTQEIVLHVREPKRVDFYRGPVCALNQTAFDHGALIIAAPLSSAEIERWLQSRMPAQIFDLRDTSSTDPLTALPQHVEHHGLHDIFTEIQQTKIRLLPVIETVKKEIVMLSEKLASRALVRPQGWDDLCA